MRCTHELQMLFSRIPIANRPPACDGQCLNFSPPPVSSSALHCYSHQPARWCSVVGVKFSPVGSWGAIPSRVTIGLQPIIMGGHRIAAKIMLIQVGSQIFEMTVRFGMLLIFEMKTGLRSAQRTAQLISDLEDTTAMNSIQSIFFFSPALA